MPNECTACGGGGTTGAGCKTSGRTCPSCDCYYHSSCTEWHGCDPCGQEVCDDCISTVNCPTCSDARVCQACREVVMK